MRFQIARPPRPSTPTPVVLSISPETELILRALQDGKVARPRPMPPVYRRSR